MSDKNELPRPPISETSCLTGYESFLINIPRLFKSETWAMSTGDEFKAAFALWGNAWLQSPPGSLPDNDKVLAGFSQAGEKWNDVKEVALRGFIKCSDGRLYHKVLVEDALRALSAREKGRNRTAAATNARKKNPEKFDRNDQRNDSRDNQRNDERNDERGDDRNGQRNGQRDDDVTTDVTFTHKHKHISISKTASSRIQNPLREDDNRYDQRNDQRNGPSLPRPSVHAGGPLLAALGDCADRAGYCHLWPPGSASSNVHLANQWAEAGITADHVLAVAPNMLARVVADGKPLKSLKYFTEALTERAAASAGELPIDRAKLRAMEVAQAAKTKADIEVGRKIDPLFDPKSPDAIWPDDLRLWLLGTGPKPDDVPPGSSTSKNSREISSPDAIGRGVSYLPSQYASGITVAPLDVVLNKGENP